MRSMKLLSSSSPGTVRIVLPIVERVIIEGRNRRVSIPISAVRDCRCWVYRLVRRRFLLPALI
jgi:hypothetical protein